MHWFYGNLYESIVFSPNWVLDSPNQIRRLNEFFILTTPTIYFVPITQIATLLVWFLLWKNKVVAINKNLKRASIWAVLATVLNVIVVSTAAIKLFGADYSHYNDFLTNLTWRWNILNIFRMTSVAITISYLFQAYRKLDKITVANN